MATRKVAGLGIAFAVALVASAFVAPVAHADPAPVTLSFTSAPSDPHAFEPVTLTVTVTGGEAGVPTGTVAFARIIPGTIPPQTQDLGTATVDPSGTATLVVTLAYGTHTVFARYSGDANYDTALTNTSVAVGAGSKTSITATSPDHVHAADWTASTPLVLTAHIAGKPAIRKHRPTGTVTFDVDGDTTVVPIVGAPKATLALPDGLSVGSHAVFATYNGDEFYGSSVGVRAVVVKTALDTSIVASPDPVAVGSDVTYTVTVANHGSTTKTAVQLTDTIPAGSTLVSAQTSSGGCTGTTTVTCALGKLKAGASATAVIVVTVDSGPTATNSATATPGTNNVATETTTVE